MNPSFLGIVLGLLALVVHEPASAQPLAPLTGAVRVASKYQHTCVINEASTVQCWGKGEWGMLGHGAPGNRNHAVAVVGLDSAVAISAGRIHTCAVTPSGVAKCWGLGDLHVGQPYGEIYVPTPIPGLDSGVLEIAAGGNNTCALTSAGAVKCLGVNDWGQLGNGEIPGSGVPGVVSGMGSGMLAVRTGERFSCAIGSGGGVRCWGYNEQGQIGNGSTGGGVRIPVQPIGLGSGVAALDVNTHHACTVMGDGKVRCWGRNYSGEIGHGGNAGTSVYVTTPTQVSGINNAIAVATGYRHTCALLATGAVKCWGGGGNPTGSLGTGLPDTSLVPVDVVGLRGPAVDITAGQYHTCVVLLDGGVDCWGGDFNGVGTLGHGSNLGSALPVAVLVVPDLIFADGFDGD